MSCGGGFPQSQTEEREPMTEGPPEGDWRGVRILSILTPWKESSSSILLSANLFDVIEIFVEVSQLSYVRLGLIFEYPLLQPWPCWNSPSCQISIFIARMKDKLTLTACGPMIAWRSAKGVNIVMNSFPPIFHFRVIQANWSCFLECRRLAGKAFVSLGLQSGLPWFEPDWSPSDE